MENTIPWNKPAFSRAQENRNPRLNSSVWSLHYVSRLPSCTNWADPITITSSGCGSDGSASCGTSDVCRARGSSKGPAEILLLFEISLSNSPAHLHPLLLYGNYFLSLLNLFRGVLVRECCEHHEEDCIINLNCIRQKSQRFIFDYFIIYLSTTRLHTVYRNTPLQLKGMHWKCVSSKSKY